MASSPTKQANNEEMFPVLSTEEIERMQRFGATQRFADGELIFQAGRHGYGLMVILQGQIAISRMDGLGNTAILIEHGPGQFSGEVAQLSGRPSLGNGHAVGFVEVLVIAPAALRALLIAEAELGERIIGALIQRRAGLLRLDSCGPVLIGPVNHARLFLLQSFLSGNGHPHTVLDADQDQRAQELVARYQPDDGDWPLVIYADGAVARNPSTHELGRALGMLPEFSADQVYDVVVVGAGPAGLAASVYAGSEGLSVLTLEQQSFGGQAGLSARIENYLGFPTGISGRELAGRAYVQAQKFGVDIAIPGHVSQLLCAESPLRLQLENGVSVRARAVVLACGARYRRPSLPNLEQFEGRGVYYWASPIEAKLCHQEEVVLVGGGNSAGQAAVFLAGHAKKVHVLVRGTGLAATMSSYLIERISTIANIELHPHTELTVLDGDDAGLKQVRWRDRNSGDERQAEVRRLFLFIGAEPNTAWLRDCAVRLNSQGFVCTGVDTLKNQPSVAARISDGEEVLIPSMLETSVPGVFAIGDVRGGSVKRVAAAVGEGAAVVAQIHSYLARAT